MSHYDHYIWYGGHLYIERDWFDMYGNFLYVEYFFVR